MAGLVGSSNLGVGIAVRHLAFDIGKHSRLVVIVEQGLIYIYLLYISSNRALVVEID